MKKNRMIYTIIVSMVLIALSLASCAPAVPATATQAVVPEATTAPAKIYKFAVLYAGSTKDGSWNTDGFAAMQAVDALDNWETSYTERTEVADLARIVDEYASSGVDMIWAHGAQFTTTIVDTLADTYPDVSFIVEGDGPNEKAATKNNVKYLDRNHRTAIYPLGYAAALYTKTNKIAYLGGLPLPYVWADIRTIEMAVADAGKPDVEVIYLMTGDFNDPVKGKQATETLIAQGVDFVVSVLDLAGSGVVQAAEEADPALNVRVTTGFSIFPESMNWATATLFKPTEQILQLAKEVEEGKLGGAITLSYGLYGSGAPRTTYLPILNVSDEINAQILQVCKDLAAGKIEVSSDTTKME